MLIKVQCVITYISIDLSRQALQTNRIFFFFFKFWDHFSNSTIYLK